MPFSGMANASLTGGSFPISRSLETLKLAVSPPPSCFPKLPRLTSPSLSHALAQGGKRRETRASHQRLVDLLLARVVCNSLSHTLWSKFSGGLADISRFQRDQATMGHQYGVSSRMLAFGRQQRARITGSWRQTSCTPISYVIWPDPQVGLAPAPVAVLTSTS